MTDSYFCRFGLQLVLAVLVLLVYGLPVLTPEDSNAPIDKRSFHLRNATPASPSGIHGHHRSNETATATVDNNDAQKSDQACHPNNTHHVCSLKTTEYGIPVVLITPGRSGSSALWQILSSLLSETIRNVVEDVGSNDKAIKDFMEEHKNDKDCWLLNILCQKQEESEEHWEQTKMAYPIFGTKWKPKMSSFHGSTAAAGLEWLAKNPHVKVIFNLRNPLDAYISEVKHRTHRTPAHCAAGDEACLAKHIEAEASTVVNTTDLLEHMKFNVQYGESAEKELIDHGVRFVKVSYEDLFFGDTAGGWLDMIHFIGANATQRFPTITKETIASVSAFEATGDNNQSSRVKNYDEVVQVLKGTKYEKYLHGTGSSPGA